MGKTLFQKVWDLHEVVPEGLRVLEKAARKFNIPLSFKSFDWSCERYAKKGSMMPEDGLDILRKFEGIYLGAVGYPGVSDHVSLWGLLVPIRRGFMQYVNYRPVRLLKGLESPLKGRGPKVSRIARGLPVGGELEYVDAGTLAQAVHERRRGVLQSFLAKISWVFRRR